MRTTISLFIFLLFISPLAADGNTTAGLNASMENATTINSSAGATNVTTVNMTVNETNASKINATAPPAAPAAPPPKNVTNASMPIEQLVQLQADQIKKLREQVEILSEEVRQLREENARLKERIAELEAKPITWEDVEDTVNSYYTMFTFWTGWIWPILAFYLVKRYRKPAREEEMEAIAEASERIAMEKQREWYSHQIMTRSIETVAEDESEVMIFRSLGIFTIKDLLNTKETELVEAFKRRYEPTADLLEHFQNRIHEIKKKLEVLSCQTQSQSSS